MIDGLTNLSERAVRGENLTLDEITAGLRAFASVRRLDVAATSILLARSAAAIPRQEWFLWAVDTTGLNKSEIYHRRKIGDLLLAVRESKVLYRKILNLSGDKMLALSRLPIQAVEGFIAVHDLQNLPIMQVRVEVEKELARLDGRPYSPKQAEQLDLFGKSLDAILEADEEEFVFKESDTAEKALNGGVSLVNAYLGYQNQQGSVNTVDLLQLKSMLQDQIRYIENIINQRGLCHAQGEIQTAADTGTCGTTLSDADNVLCGATPDCTGDGVRPQTGGEAGNCANRFDDRGGIRCGTTLPDVPGTGETSGVCPGDGARAVQIPRSGAEPEEGVPPPHRPGDRPAGGAGDDGDVPDTPNVRPEWKEPAHLQQLPELDEAGCRVPCAPESGGDRIFARR